jgi:hypothetical protein
MGAAWGKAGNLRQRIAVAGTYLQHAVGWVELKKPEDDIVLCGGLACHDTRNKPA